MLLYTGIKNARVPLRTLNLAIVLFIISLHASAHFGSKGPFGGTVSCAITQDSLVYIGTANGGVFESTSNGLTAWRARPVGLTSGSITALAHTGTDLIAATSDSGIFIFNGYLGSDRYWNKINTGLTNLKIRSLLALDSVTIIAGTDGSGLFKTINKGATWIAINNPLLNNAAITGLVKAGNRIILTSLNGGVFVSGDLGTTWTDFNDANTLNIAGSTSLSYNSATDVLLVSNINGLYKASSASTINTVSYSAAQAGLPANIVVRGISNSATDWYLATDKGVYTTAANTINWAALNNGLPGTNVTAIAVLQNRLIAGVAKEGIFKATAGTDAWTALNSNFNNPVTRAMTAAGDSLVVAVTDKGVYISRDLATTYTLSNSGLTDSLNINDIIVADFGLLAATENGGVFFTSDTGKTWIAANTGLTNLNIKKLFFATGYKYAIDAGGNIFESPLHTSNWTAVQTGLSSGVNLTSMAFYAGKLILGTSGNGVYLRNQHEGSWVAANTGLSNLAVTSVTASGNKIFAGTSGSGVFVSDFATVSWSQTAATSIAHTTMIGLNGNNIQAMASFGGYVYASYKGGLLATSDNGATWIAGGNQFNLPSFTDINNVSFVTSRVFVPTENNAVYSNALSELPALPDTLILSETSIAVTASPQQENVISVTSNRAWTVSADQAWITLSKNSGLMNEEFLVAVSPNTGAGPRTGTITVTAGTKIKTVNIIQNGTTGITETSALLSNVGIYPNPSNGSFTVDLAASAVKVKKVSVYDITGKLLKEATVEAGNTSIGFSLAHAPGVYFVHFDTDKGSAAQKIIIR